MTCVDLVRYRAIGMARMMALLAADLLVTAHAFRSGPLGLVATTGASSACSVSNLACSVSNLACSVSNLACSNDRPRIDR